MNISMFISGVRNKAAKVLTGIASRLSSVEKPRDFKPSPDQSLPVKRRKKIIREVVDTQKGIFTARTIKGQLPKSGQDIEVNYIMSVLNKLQDSHVIVRAHMQGTTDNAYKLKWVRVNGDINLSKEILNVVNSFHGTIRREGLKAGEFTTRDVINELQKKFPEIYVKLTSVSSMLCTLRDENVIVSIPNETGNTFKGNLWAVKI